MNHSLSVYTVIYLAILFVTVSIYGGQINAARGDAVFLLVAQAIFSLKLAIDDYIHFQARVPGHETVHVSLWFSLLIYLLLASSVAWSSMGDLRLAEHLFACVFLLGNAWICFTETHHPPSEEDRARHFGWFLLNLLSIGILLLDAYGYPGTDDIESKILCGALAIVFVVDFVCYGTLKRLAMLSSN